MNDDRAADEVVRARLAYVTAGQRPLCAPRRAVEDTEEIVEARTPVSSGQRRWAWPSAMQLTARHIVALAVLLLAAAVVALVTITGSAATSVPLITPSVDIPSSPASSSHPSPRILRVHVAGAVLSPGVVSLAEGMIVQDAILAAGGLASVADAHELNLAAPLSEGMQIIIGTAASPRGEAMGSATGSGSAGGLVNLNEATADQLEQLPGIGPVSAQAIVAWREEHGRFTSVAELQEISGIGPKTFAKLEPLVRV